MLNVTVKSNFKSFKKDLLVRLEEYVKLNDKEVIVGIPDKARNDDGELIKDYANANEYGVISQNLPARPFMKKSLKAKYLSNLKSVFKKNGHLYKKGDADILLEALGIQGTENVRQAIDTEEYAPLDPKTIARKGNDKELRDTDAMYNAFDYNIRRRK